MKRWPALIVAAALVSATPAHAVSGGETVAVSTVPYVVGLGGCTGTLIAPDRVLTAAHCVTSYDRPDRIGIVIGEDKNKGWSGKFAHARGVAIMKGYKLQYPFAHRRAQNATAVSINNGVGSVGLSGTAVVSPTTSTTYTVTATGANNQQSTCSIAVAVTAGGTPNPSVPM